MVPAPLAFNNTPEGGNRVRQQQQQQQQQQQRHYRNHWRYSSSSSSSSPPSPVVITRPPAMTPRHHRTATTTTTTTTNTTTASKPPTLNPADTCICVIGVGFVGESLTREFGRIFPTIGFDISRPRIQSLRASLSQQNYPLVELTTDEAALSRGTHFLVSVPTLLRADRSVNLGYVRAALATVFKHARPGSSVVIESSVSVGTTRELLGPYRHTFHCGMSPERVDPGRTIPAAGEIPKVVSALSPASLKAIVRVYAKVFKTVVPVSKPEVAEMTKLFENCYRMVNIAYANEMGDACRSHGIDPSEMIRAAATKPYGFEAFYPGLGVGGHCIPVNPYYLFANNKNLPVLERATKLMWNRPLKLARKFHRRCLPIDPQANDRAGVMPRILVVGVGFKPGQSVLSCSPGLAFAQTLKDIGCARLAFYDPLVPQEDVTWMEKLETRHWNPSYIDAEFDGIAVCTAQQGVDFSVTVKLQRTFVRHFSEKSDKAQAAVLA